MDFYRKQDDAASESALTWELDEPSREQLFLFRTDANCSWAGERRTAPSELEFEYTPETAESDTCETYSALYPWVQPQLEL